MLRSLRRGRYRRRCGRSLSLNSRPWAMRTGLRSPARTAGPVKVETKTTAQHVFQPSKELWDEILRKRAEFETLRDGNTDDDTSPDSF